MTNKNKKVKERFEKLFNNTGATLMEIDRLWETIEPFIQQTLKEERERIVKLFRKKFPKIINLIGFDNFLHSLTKPK